MITLKGAWIVNLSMLAVILLAWQLLSNSPNTRQNPSPPPQIGIADFLNDDTKNMLNCVNKLTNSTNTQDTTSAIFEIISNPAVMNIASNLFGSKGNSGAQGEQGQESSSTTAQTSSETDNPHVNEEGYRFETPSESSQEFFRQIDNIADAEVKHKLYWFYDNWYVK